MKILILDLDRVSNKFEVLKDEVVCVLTKVLLKFDIWLYKSILIMFFYDLATVELLVKVFNQLSTVTYLFLLVLLWF